MIAVSMGKLLRLGAAGKRGTVELPLDRACFRGREIYLAGFLVDPCNSVDLPIAVSDLRQLLASQIIKIEVAEAGALTGPEEALIVIEEAKIVGEIDPVFILLGEHGLAFASGSIGEEQIEAILR